MYYVFILQFFIISFSLTILVESATDARYAHASALINNQLFIIGGQRINSPIKGSNDVFYLDLTKSFDLQDPPLEDLTSTSGMPFSISWATSTVLRKDGILLYGGYAWSLNSGNLDNGDNSLYLFNTTTKQWSIPTVSGASPPRRREMEIVSDNNENIYIYSGIQLSATENTQWFTDMNILDAQSSSFKWELVPMRNVPTFPRADYTATMLPSGVIVYIGGRTREVRNGVFIEMDLNITQIVLYDTKDANWHLMDTIGDFIDSRNSHSAVLASDGKIIIYGGAKGSNLTTASPSLAILDTSTSTYTWSIPQIESTQLSPPPLILHTADLYEDYMIVSFGNITNRVTTPVEVNSRIYMLDTKTFSWITSYTPKLIASPEENHPTSTGLIIGIVCAVIVFLVISGIIGWLVYKNCRKNHPVAIPTPGSGMDRVERDERDDRDEFNNNRVSNITSVTDNSYNNNPRNSSTTDITVVSNSRPPSSYKSTTTYGTTPYAPSYPSTPSYTPYGGFTPKNPPYSTRN